MRLRRGVYADASVDDPLLSYRAAALAHPDAVLSHGCATLTYRLPLLGAPPMTPTMTVPPRKNANLPGVHVHRAALRAEDISVIDGIAVTSPARTLIDLARHRPTAAGVTAIDAALHHGLVTSEELDDVLRFCWNWPRIRHAQRAVRLADPAAESPLESVSRLTMSWLGVPTPALQRTVLGPSGRFMGRLDFYWDREGVAGEADGLLKYDARDALLEEKVRQEAMEDLGIVFARWGWAEATRRRYALRDRLDRAFARGRARDRSGFPRGWSLARA